MSEVLLLPKFPVRADRAGNVLDGDGKLIGNARFSIVGQLKNTQLVSRHFAASFDMAIALRNLLNTIDELQAADRASPEYAAAKERFELEKVFGRDALGRLDENFKDETKRTD